MDFSFSLLYLVVLFSLNPLLTLVTLSTLPLFVVLALIANPIVEDQINKVVQEGVRTNSYLTEAITGIQTIKSQNAELKPAGISRTATAASSVRISSSRSAVRPLAPSPNS